MLSGDDYGEKYQPFSIEGNEIQAFRSSYAIANPPSNAWAVVSEEMVEQLARESKLRIEASSEFAEVYQRLEEVRENAGVIRPADLVERREEEREKSEVSPSSAGQAKETTDADAGMDADTDADTNTDTGADTGDQELEEAEEISPQLAEATNVLVDLIAANRSSQSTAKNRGIGIR
jgi:hypothetical protein